MTKESQTEQVPKLSNRRPNWTERCYTVMEIVLIFGLFFVYGGWPVPDVNEQYYIGKAIHFWHPDLLAADHFLNTPDSHWLFYAVFGTFSLIFPPPVLAWFGRCLIWLLTAWSWRSLSFALIPRRWFSVLTAAGLLFYLDAFHLAGEWLVGGVEGKGFAFPFVFWGLAAFLTGRFRICWILLGIASAFHVLVGGWTVLAALFSWTISELLEKRSIKRVLSGFCSMLPFLFIGGAISLIGLLPALGLDRGASPETVHLAHRIYVFERLGHHLVPSTLPWIFLLRFLLLTGIWLLFCCIPIRQLTGRSRIDLQEKAIADGIIDDKSTGSSDLANCGTARRLNCFVFAAVTFMLIGFLLDFGFRAADRLGWIVDRKTAADLLRFYWFRLSDWAVPFGVVFGAALFFFRSGRLFLSESILSIRRNRFSRTAGRFFVLLTGTILVYVVFKEIYTFISVRQALAQTVDPNYPVPPRPVEGVAFLSALFLSVTVYSIWTVFRKKLKRNRQFWGFTGLFFLSLVIAVGGPAFHFLNMLSLRTSPVIPRCNPQKESISNGWIETCHWVKNRKNTDRNAVFLVPCGYNSFKWYAERAEAAAWKEIPQDAVSIVNWYDRIQALYAMPGAKGAARWNQPLVVLLISKGRNRVLRESRTYGIDYIIVENPPYALTAYPKAMERWQEFADKDLVYQNSQFSVLCFTGKEEESVLDKSKDPKSDKSKDLKKESESR